MKARKTEYKGIVFRSKSEAILARLLDINCVDWVYEPGLGSNFDHPHSWDFLIGTVAKRDRGPFHSGQVLTETYTRLECIEYKPSRPTDTYITELKEIALAEIVIDAEGESDPIVNATIWYGSAYNDAGFMYIPLVRNGGLYSNSPLAFPLSFSTDDISYAKSHRFDLVGSV